MDGDTALKAFCRGFMQGLADFWFPWVFIYRRGIAPLWRWMFASEGWDG